MPRCRHHIYNRECTSCRKQREDSEAVERQKHIDWYEQTGHCGACGEPGVFCVCTVPCGCAELHEVGCGIGRSAADVFAESAPVVIEQDGLF